ncbi:hypothetical protein J3459_018398 [Metarhizium acridum]|nr:hypothetical protein J3459_018398 [Metarhizium acridum]
MIDYYTEKSTLILWTSEFLYSWAIFCAKIAVLCFFLRVFRFSSIRIPIILLITLCSIWITIRTFFTLLRCRPVQAFWVQSIKDATCFTNVRAYYLGTDVTHSSMDFIILALPIYEVSRMKLPFGQKIAVVGLFATGSLVGIASIFQIVESQNYDPHELPYDLALCMVWGGVELHLAVFIGKWEGKPPSLQHCNSLLTKLKVLSFYSDRYLANSFLVLPPKQLARLRAARLVRVLPFSRGRVPDALAVCQTTLS